MSWAEAFSQTPWWRWSTSTGGTVPSALRRLGAMRRIQPSSVGLGTWPLLNWMAFWPGWMVMGPYSKCIRWVPAGPVGAALVVVEGTAVVVGAAVVVAAPTTTLPPFGSLA